MTMTFVNEEKRLKVLYSHFGQLALERLEELEEGIDLGRLGKKAELTVHDSGVNVQRGFIEDIHGLHILGKPRPAETGEVFKGTIRELTGNPKVGGYVHLDTWRSTVLTGLVDPQSGVPRVGLDILSKHRVSR